MLQLGKQIPVYIHRNIERVCTTFLSATYSKMCTRGAIKIIQREYGGGGLLVPGQIKGRPRFVDNVGYTYMYRKQISELML